MKRDLGIGLAWFAILFAYDAWTSSWAIDKAMGKVKHAPEAVAIVQREVSIFLLQFAGSYVLMGLVAGIVLHLVGRSFAAPRALGPRLVTIAGVTAWITIRGAISWPRLFTGAPGAVWIAENGTPAQVDLTFGVLALTALGAGWILRRPSPVWPAATVVTAVLIGRLDHQPRATPVEPSPGPNVVILSFDALRPDHLASFGYDRQTTPALDAFLEQAAVYESAFTPLARTWPAWTSILTGADPLRHGLRDSLPAPGAELPQVPLLTTLLQDAGYHTTFLTDDSRFSYMLPEHGWDTISQPPVGIRAFAPSRYQPYFRSFFTFLHGPLSGWKLVPTYRYNQAYGATHRTDYFAEHVADAIGRASKHERFFVAAHVCLLHAPADRPWPYHSIWGMKGFKGGNRWKYRSTGSPAADGDQWDAERLRKLEYQARARQQNIDLYDAGLSMVDDTFARINEALEVGGVWENTLVLVISDHGEDFLNDATRYDYRGPNHGYTPYGTGQNQVLLAIRGAGFEPGRYDALTGLIDVAPTIARYAGIEGLSADGLALQDAIPDDRVLFGETGVAEDGYWPEGHRAYPFERSHHRYTVDPETTRVFQRPKYDRYTILAKDRWLITKDRWLVETNLESGPDYELFDWKADPEFAVDLLDREPETTAELRTLLAARPFLYEDDGQPTWPDAEAWAYTPEPLEPDTSVIGPEKAP